MFKGQLVENSGLRVKSCCLSSLDHFPLLMGEPADAGAVGPLLPDTNPGRTRSGVQEQPTLPRCEGKENWNLCCGEIGAEGVEPSPDGHLPSTGQ